MFPPLARWVGAKFCVSRMASIHPELIRIAARQVRVWRNPSPSNARPNLILVHGGLGDARWHWHTVWETLADSFNVAAPDLPRFGSTVELPHTSFAELIEWLARVQELLGMSQAVLVGNSFGASLARLYAAAHPERVTHLILVDGGQIPQTGKLVRRVISAPFMASVFELIGQQQFSEAAIKRAFGNPALVTPQVLTESQDASHGFVSLMRQVVLSDVPPTTTPRAPTLLVWGERDKLASLQRADEIGAQVSATRLAIIKNAGHLPQLEDPLSFVKIVNDFCLPNV